MIKKILIANRGEIAVRIIRACREMGIQTVAIYSEADKDALHVQIADESVCIGPPPSSESYLRMDRIISATLITGADAIHPGVGFLSENSEFAELCEKCNITFIGPTSSILSMMGNKSTAKNLVKSLGVPVVPGSVDGNESMHLSRKYANEIGYPVIVKASLGGGGKGMRSIFSDVEFENEFYSAQKEAINAFGDGRLYVEKLIKNPRHIEFQILADRYGKVLHLGERECSIQRKHQKLIEESPSVSLTNSLRDKMAKCSVKIAKEVKYIGAGTIEYLLDDSGHFYFMEMNTRVQVEHPVTELVVGIDIIKEQIRIANGEKLNRNQKDIKILGHAIECRINAENPLFDFRPSPGTIKNIYMPGGPGVRIDTSLYNGCEIPPYYDSLLAKVIVHASNRSDAIRKLTCALGEIIIEGIDSNIVFLYNILTNESYKDNEIDINFLERSMSEFNYEVEIQ